MTSETRLKTAFSQAERVIRCTEHNAKAFQQIIKSTPELLALVQSLQAQNLFPGLRAMTIAITGSPQIVAQGLAAWPGVYQSSQRHTTQPQP